MIYALMLMISFVAIYALLGGPALTINSWLGDRNQFIQPGTSVYNSSYELKFLKIRAFRYLFDSDLTDIWSKKW